MHITESDAPESGTVHYPSNVRYWKYQGGQWVEERVYTGNTASDWFWDLSLAIGLDGQPAIASHLGKHVPTGSATNTRLLYHQRKADGGWTTETVATPRGRLRGQGRIAIHRCASRNCGLIRRAGRTSSSPTLPPRTTRMPSGLRGQIRHAVRSGGKWTLQTAFSQTNTLHEQVIDPTIAISPQGKIVLAGITEVFTPGPNNAYRYADTRLQIVTAGAGPVEPGPDLVYQIPTGTAGNVIVRRNGDNLELVRGPKGPVLYSQPLADTNSLTIRGTDAKSDVLTVDLASGGGWQLPGGILFAGGAGTPVDKLSILATLGADSFVVASDHVVVNGLGWVREAWSR